jgi:hypothetical protein
VLIFHNSCTGDQVTLFTNYFLSTLTTKLNDSFGKSMVPNISLIMVNAKTSERFFLSDRNGARNVNAETLVANEIVPESYKMLCPQTPPLRRDFFSQYFNYTN